MDDIKIKTTDNLSEKSLEEATPPRNRVWYRKAVIWALSFGMAGLLASPFFLKPARKTLMEVVTSVQDAGSETQKKTDTEGEDQGSSIDRDSGGSEARRTSPAKQRRVTQQIAIGAARVNPDAIGSQQPQADASPAPDEQVTEAVSEETGEPHVENAGEISLGNEGERRTPKDTPENHDASVTKAVVSSPIKWKDGEGGNPEEASVNTSTPVARPHSKGEGTKPVETVEGEEDGSPVLPKSERFKDYALPPADSLESPKTAEKEALRYKRSRVEAFPGVYIEVQRRDGG